MLATHQRLFGAAIRALVLAKHRATDRIESGGRTLVMSGLAFRMGRVGSESRPSDLNRAELGLNEGERPFEYRAMAIHAHSIAMHRV